MDGQELIQVNLRLPAGALDSLSALVEQLRKLAAAVNGPGMPAGRPEEAAESGFFDPERFRALREKAEAAAERRLSQDPAQAQTARREVLAQLREAESAGREIAEGPGSGEKAVPPPAAEENFREPAPQGGDPVREEDGAEIPSVKQAAESHLPDAPTAGGEPENRVEAPQADAARDRGAEPPLPPAPQADMLAGVETPMGAGMVVTSQAEPPASRWTGVTEELVTPGPAPLTAEAVSLAFQRDGRRYDNGFPLY